MKSYFIVFLLCPAFLLAQKGGFTISGSLANYPASALVHLSYAAGGETQRDSAVIHDGKFSFAGTVNKPGMASIMIFTAKNDMHTSMYLSLYLEPGRIVVSSPDSLQNALVSGTPLNDDNTVLKSMLKPSAEKMKQLGREYAALASKEEKAAFSDKNKDRISAVSEEQKKAKEQFIAAHPASLVSLDAIRTISSPYPNPALSDSLFQLLSATLRDSDAGKAYAAQIRKMKMTDIGSLAPDFTEKDTVGLSISLHSFRGRYVLIDFWASWCGPCRAENPNLLKAYTANKEKNFTVLGVALERPEDRQKWIDAINTDKMPWAQVSDLKFWQNSAAVLYNVNAIPQNFLVDPQGKIIAKNLRGDALDKLALYIK